MSNDGIFDMEEIMSVEKILALVGAILLIVSVFLTYISLEGEIMGEDIDESWSGMDSDTRDNVSPNPIIILVFGILCLVGAIIHRNFELLQGYMPIVLLVLGIIALILVGLDYMDVKDDVDEGNDSYDAAGLDAEAKVGIGLYIGLIGSILVVVGGILCFLKKEEV